MARDSDPRDWPRCLLCGLILPPPPLRWWQRTWFTAPPPVHDPAGPYAAVCWQGLCRRVGLPPDTPMP